MAIEMVDTIDLTAEPDIETFNPILPDLDAVDISKVAFSYDRESDTLLLHLFGLGRQTVSVVGPRFLYALVDSDTEEFVGFHAEHFLAHFVRLHPELFDILDVAELRGISRQEIRSLRHRLFSPRQRLMARLRQLWTVRPDTKKRAVLKQFLDDGRQPVGPWVVAT